MSDSWQSALDRWQSAGLLEATTASRIREFETSQEQAPRLRWPILIAIGFGGLMLAAGVLLFVSAHWDELSPSARFSVVLLLVAIFHIAGGFFAERMPAMSTALHAVGTAALGAGIFLSAQIFNLREHWPGGVMLWGIGSWIALGLRHDWVQVAYVALLTPGWLASEWIDATQRMKNSEQIVAQGLLLLAVTYLTALTTENRTATRRVLAWIGGIAVIPAAILSMPEAGWGLEERKLSTAMLILGRVVGTLIPLLLAWRLRKRGAVWNMVAAVWVLVLQFIPTEAKISPYIWAGLASLGLIAWGVHESRRERINLGVLSFGLTVLMFYFSNVMDKLGRSASLIGLGLLFLILAWGLERTRRQLVAKVKAAAV